MSLLRRFLYWQAAVWVGCGVAIAVAPRWVLVSLFDQPVYPQYAYVRVCGVMSVGLALFMVLIAQRIEDLWWWSWAFALMTTAVVTVVVLNAAFGLQPGESSVLWWLFAAVAVGFDLALLYGLFVASRENPTP